MIHIHTSISQNFNGNALEHTRYDIYTPIRKRIPLPPEFRGTRTPATSTTCLSYLLDEYQNRVSAHPLCGGRQRHPTR